MYHHLDDFTLYDVVRTSGSMDLTWLSTVYQVNQSGNENFRIADWAGGRSGVGTAVETIGTRSLYLPVGHYLLANKKTINVTARLLDYVPNGTAIGGLSLVSDGQDQHIVSFGFTDAKTGYVAYVGLDNVVRHDVFLMATSLTGIQDVIEWGFEKSANSRSEYKPFTLWVNNKPVYADTAFCQVGSIGNLSVRLTGGVAVLPAGSVSESGFINAAGNVQIPKCGITDIVINDGARNGLTRVLSRMASGDTGPNTMTLIGSASSHAEAVSNLPVNTTTGLQANTATAEEMFGALAFDNLSSESVLAFGIRALGSKNNPFATDFASLLKIGSSTYNVGSIPLDITPGFASVIIDQNPATGVSWTALEANSAQFGIKVE